VLPSARRLSELGVVSGEELTAPALIEEAPRGLSAPELVADGRDTADVDPVDVDPAGLVRAVR
jgi:hypothetical protein